MDLDNESTALLLIYGLGGILLVFLLTYFRSSEKRKQEDEEQFIEYHQYGEPLDGDHIDSTYY